MDLPHLVQTLTGRLLRSPALHYVVLGGLLYAVVSVGTPPPPPQRLVIPGARVEAAIREYEGLKGSPLTPPEREHVLQAVMNEEVLYTYARRLGLDRQPVVERRLAQIATFVEENPHAGRSTRDLANEAVQLSLSEGDLVIRRILIDGARRLIRAPVLIREPPDVVLERYLREHPDEFRSARRTRLSHVSVNDLVHGERTARDALALLTRLRADSVPPQRAAEYGDHGLVTANLPLLPDVELERRFGHRFVKHLAGLPEGSWQGPLPSRYGAHLVFVQERELERPASLAEVRKEVRARVRHTLADEWLAIRLAQLRGEYRVEVRGGGDGTARP